MTGGYRPWSKFNRYTWSVLNRYGHVEASELARADDGQVIRHTVSIGVAARLPGDMTFETILRRADLALYRAKESGRNQVVAG